GLDEELDGFLADLSEKKSTNILDAAGATIVAGFNDSHAHSVWFGQTLVEANLAAATTPNQVYAAISHEVSSLDENQWVICANFNPLQMIGSVNRDHLDIVAEGRPVLIKHQ